MHTHAGHFALRYILLFLTTFIVTNEWYNLLHATLTIFNVLSNYTTESNNTHNDTHLHTLCDASVCVGDEQAKWVPVCLCVHVGRGQRHSGPHSAINSTDEWKYVVRTPTETVDWHFFRMLHVLLRSASIHFYTFSSDEEFIDSIPNWYMTA